MSDQLSGGSARPQFALIALLVSGMIYFVVSWQTNDPIMALQLPWPHQWKALTFVSHTQAATIPSPQSNQGNRKFFDSRWKTGSHGWSFSAIPAFTSSPFPSPVAERPLIFFLKMIPKGASALSLNIICIQLAIGQSFLPPNFCKPPSAPSCPSNFNPPPPLADQSLADVYLRSGEHLFAQRTTCAVW